MVFLQFLVRLSSALAKMVETQGPQQDSIFQHRSCETMDMDGMEWYGMECSLQCWTSDLASRNNRSLSHATLPAYQGIDLQAGKEEGGPKLSPMEEQLVLAS